MTRARPQGARGGPRWSAGIRAGLVAALAATPLSARAAEAVAVASATVSASWVGPVPTHAVPTHAVPTHAAPTRAPSDALARPAWLLLASGGTPFVGLELRARPSAPLELALAVDLVGLDAALRAVARASWLPVRGDGFEVGAELGAGGAAALRSASTLDAELGLRARARLVPRVDADLRLTLLGYRGPSAAETGLLVAPRLRLAWWVTDGFAVGAEGGALVGWSSAAPVAGLFVRWAPGG